MVNTIVTAFIDIGNGNRSIDKYIEYGKELLSIDIDQITFIEREVFNKYFNYNEEILIFVYEGKEYAYIEVGNKTFVFFEKSDIYFYNYNVSQVTVYTDNPSKDTIDYMFTICHKTEWVKMATELKKDRESFVWIDFGIFHMIQSKERALNEFHKIKHKELNKIRIASWFSLQYSQDLDIYKRPLWYFAGCVFGGPRDSIIDFANRTKEKCLHIITEKESLIWEGNIWFMIYLDCPLLFDTYMCRNDISVLYEF